MKVLSNTPQTTSRAQGKTLVHGDDEVDAVDSEHRAALPGVDKEARFAGADDDASHGMQPGRGVYALGEKCRGRCNRLPMKDGVPQAGRWRAWRAGVPTPAGNVAVALARRVSRLRAMNPSLPRAPVRA